MKSFIIVLICCLGLANAQTSTTSSNTLTEIRTSYWGAPIQYPGQLVRYIPCPGYDGNNYYATSACVMPAYGTEIDGISLNGSGFSGEPITVLTRGLSTVSIPGAFDFVNIGNILIEDSTGNVVDSGQYLRLKIPCGTNIVGVLDVNNTVIFDGPRIHGGLINSSCM